MPPFIIVTCVRSTYHRTSILSAFLGETKRADGELRGSLLLRARPKAGRGPIERHAASEVRTL
jgi:hypothetical protein